MKIKIINSLAAAALLTGSLGVLQAEEAKSTDAKPAKAKAAKKSDRPSQRAAFIKRFDKDGDGKLNEAERKAAAALRKAQGARQSDRASDKARPNSGGRERYAAAAMKIKEAVKMSGWSHNAESAHLCSICFQEMSERREFGYYQKDPIDNKIKPPHLMGKLIPEQHG